MLLKDKFPKVIHEFLAEENLGTNLAELGIGSRQLVKWKCQKGHSWQATPNQRTSGGKLRGCPVCAGKVVVPETSIAITDPSLATEWDTTKNQLIPTTVSRGSNRLIWWKCKNGHSWQASPKQRLKGNSCPLCSSLAFRSPEIASQWHTLKNGISPDKIAYSSHTKYWWKCPKGFDHAWEASPNSRTSNNSGCPICSGHKVVFSNCLAATHPQIAIQWDHEKNDGLSPEDVHSGSLKRVWWRCEVAPDHKWEASVKSRKLSPGCPMCSGRKTVESNSLYARFPLIAQYWNTVRNGNLLPTQVTPYSSKVVWWKCPEGSEHEWQSTVANVANGSGCPVCLNRKITVHNNLATQYPKLMAEWDYEKNNPLNPSELAPGSKLKAWWKCKKDEAHFWLASIHDRTNKDSGCPVCGSKHNVSEQKLLAIVKNLFPSTQILYRNKPSWLPRLELDIYLPELQLAFEYQGHQHFMPVSIFGGEQAYIEQAKRDAIKRQICLDKDVALIYVCYQEKISEELVKEKLILANIPLESTKRYTRNNQNITLG